MGTDVDDGAIALLTWYSYVEEFHGHLAKVSRVFGCLYPTTFANRVVYGVFTLLLRCPLCCVELELGQLNYIKSFGIQLFCNSCSRHVCSSLDTYLSGESTSLLGSWHLGLV